MSKPFLKLKTGKIIDADILNGDTLLHNLKQYSGFKKDEILEVIIPDFITELDNLVFCDCINLKSIIIPKSVKKIGKCAFFGCESLESLEIPESVTEIRKLAFYECFSLTSITIPESSLKLGRQLF